MTKGSIATVKGFEARAMKAEFRRVRVHATLFATMLPCVSAFTTTVLFLVLRRSGPQTDECPPGARREMIRTMAHDTIHGLSTIETSIDHRLTTGNPVRAGY